MAKHLIMGAAGGMGAVAARLSAQQGNDLVLVDRPSDALKHLEQECRQLGCNVRAYRFDLTDPESLNSLIDNLRSEAGITGCIYTIGVSPQMAPAETIIDIDIIKTRELISELKGVIAAGGALVAITSMSAYLCPPNTELEACFRDRDGNTLISRLKADHPDILDNPGLAYSYSKKALLQYVQQESMTWGKEGKRIVSIAPGLIATDMGNQEMAAVPDFEKRLAMVSAGRMGAPEEIAHTALFLLSEQASYITGCDILVDGGFIGNVQALQR
ncbi:MAG: hypothetical protein RI942_2078 [Pseudomonadota bacterium]